MGEPMTTDLGETEAGLALAVTSTGDTKTIPQKTPHRPASPAALK